MSRWTHHPDPEVRSLADERDVALAKLEELRNAAKGVLSTPVLPDATTLVAAQWARNELTRILLCTERDVTDYEMTLRELALAERAVIEAASRWWHERADDNASQNALAARVADLEAARLRGGR